MRMRGFSKTASIKYHELLPAFRIITACILFFVTESRGQVSPEVDVLQQQQLENASQASGEDADLSELEETRLYLSQHPLDINNSSYEELMRSGLINDLQAQELSYHIKANGKLITPEELQTINGFDIVTIRSILPYISVKAEPDLMRRGFNDVLRSGKHTVLIRTQQVLEEQKGYSPKEDPDDTRYLGSPLKLYARYRFTFGSQVSVGITGEKDAGEEFFAGSQKKGFDFYSAHLYIKDRQFTVALGDYQLKYGQGLVMWSGVATGKTSDVINIKRNNIGIRPYSSVNEFSYLRGGAVSYNIKKFTVDAFYSNRKIDASTVQSDTLSDEILISSFAEDGYHRTESELKRKDVVNSQLAGGHIGFRSGQLELGVTGFYDWYSIALEQNSDLYSKFDPSGKEIWNAGVHYSYNFRNILLFGETARSGNDAFSTLNGIMVSLDPGASFSLLYRNYSKDYEMLYANSFRESDNANEKGLYMGLSLSPVKGITWNNYIDLFRFPWLRFQVDAPSYGNEFLSQLTWVPDRRTTLYIRYKQQEKEENQQRFSKIDELAVTRQQNIRFNASYKISPSFTLQSRVELSVRKTEGTSVENGNVLFQDLQYNKLGSPITASFRFAVFDTDSYDTRIYAFESDIPGIYSIPSYYYEGRRVYLMLRYKITRDIDFWVRYGTSIYDNQDVVGSGLDEIDGNHKSELKMQVRVEF